MSCRIITGIALRESNKHGGYLFMYLYTRKEIHSDDWTKLPIYNGVIKRLEELEKKTPLLTNILCLNGHQGYSSWTT